MCTCVHTRVHVGAIEDVPPFWKGDDNNNNGDSVLTTS